MLPEQEERVEPPLCSRMNAGFRWVRTRAAGAHAFFFSHPVFAGRSMSNVSGPFLFTRLAFRPFAKTRAGGDAGRIPSPTAVCTKEKVQTRVVTAKAGSSPGVRHAWRLFRECRKRQARSPNVRAEKLRTMVFGLISRGPRWTDQAIHRWRDSSACKGALARAGSQAAKEAPCDERQARRSNATSAAARRLRVTRRMRSHRSRSAQPPRFRLHPYVRSGREGI